MEITHRFIETNGIRMHIAEAGAGPLVVLLHGFPESWHSWRHQLAPIAEAGYHVVAPDLRGYGQTDRPSEVEAYSIFHLTADIVGLVHALGEAQAIVVGHDWGAFIASYLALFRPDLFRALVLLSVPYSPRHKVNQSTWEQHTYPDKLFYQALFRSPMAEQYFESDVRSTRARSLYCASGEASPEERWRPVRDPGHSAPHAPAKLPSWIGEEDAGFLVSEFTRTGFTGGLNYYRNMDRNWEMTAFLDRAKILLPTLFIAGESDAVIEFMQPACLALNKNIPNLRKKVLLPGVGHWTQQEAPAEVNRHILNFLATM